MLRATVTRPARSPLLALQLLISAAVLLLPIVPPAQGRMLLLPLTAEAAARLPRTVIARGALLLGTGPLPGSLVVIGDRATLGRPLLAIGAVAIATGAGGCVAPQP